MYIVFIIPFAILQSIAFRFIIIEKYSRSTLTYATTRSYISILEIYDFTDRTVSAYPLTITISDE